ncbi:MAG TPA: peptidoglycan DD-metalloendopeptidase family protein, partial [Anaerolineales bacterium]|nr:peptidoglycan DD-metalloendopeptidase family protein [Anaerolineales bacterium]
MKRLIPLILLTFLASCTSPQPAPTPEATSTPIILPPTSTATLPPTAGPTATLSPTETPIPCDPFTAEFCITDGTLILQRPILPPGNDSVDISYRYGTSAKRTRDPHHGVEFLNKFGTPVHAAADGEVVFAGSDMTSLFSPWSLFYGNMILIRHADGIHTLYAHLSVIDVMVGQSVTAGQKIGEVGQTGGATGSHLHFEVRRGRDATDYFSTENPELWLIPRAGTGSLSIALDSDRTTKLERDIVLTGSTGINYYVFTYAKGFEHHREDLAIG